MSDNLVQTREDGQVFIAGGFIDIANLLWHEHAKFTGVALKHLVIGRDTEHKFSCHLVRVRRGCEIGIHLHEGKWELHEVLRGKGTCLIGREEIAYQAGIAALIPADVPHKVTAKEKDLYIAAKFIPALL